MKLPKFFLSERFLSKLPFSLLVAIFIVPILLLQINPHLGLFAIAFYISYWTIKVFESYYYILGSYITLLRTNKKDYLATEVIQNDAKNLRHIVVVPIYTEPQDVVEHNILSILHNHYPYKNQITVLLATEERGGEEAIEIANTVVAKYHGQEGIEVVNVVHPGAIPGEGKVKGANITYAMKEYMNGRTLDPQMTFVHSIDTDTLIEKNFFLITSFVFLSSEKRDHAIYQYTPVYSNNWHKSTFFARLIAMGTTFWQLSESQNPEFYRNFAVYGQSLACLQKSNFWSLTSIVEDGLQYWRSYFAYDGVFRIVNVPAVCKMDVVEEANLFKTVRSQYKQLRRWSWGCTDVEFVIPQFLKNKKISTYEKIRKIGYLIANHLFWSSGPLTLFLVGYMPGVLDSLRDSIVTLTIPLTTSLIFTWTFMTVVFPSFLSIMIMKKYTRFRKRDYIFNLLQWALIPILTLTLFSLPAIESQFRLFLGKRIDFFETTKKMKRG